MYRQINYVLDIFYLKNVISNWCDKERHYLQHIFISVSLFLHASIDLCNQIHIYNYV